MIIPIGDPQPLPCPQCKDKLGYKQSQLIQISYLSEYGPDGQYTGGFYSDGFNLINNGVTAYCINCSHKLPFKLKHNE